MRFSKLLMVMILACLAIISCSNNNTQAKVEGNDTEENAPSEDKSSTPPQTIIPPEDLSGNLQVITEEEFVQKISEYQSEKGFSYKGKTPCIVDFYADWCRPCTALTPILAEMAMKYKGKIIIYKVNVDRAQRLSAALKIESIPMLLFFKPNTQPTMIVGAPQKEELEKAINEILL